MIKNNKYFITLVLIGLALLSGIFHKKFDLTSDKKYTLTDESIKVLKNVKTPLNIDVYLDGDFPAEYKRFQKEILSLLDEFKSVNSNVNYRLINPIEEKISVNELKNMGINPSTVRAERRGVVSQIEIFPYATMTYAGNDGELKGETIQLVASQQSMLPEEQIAKSIDQLEYTFINSISRLEKDKRKVVGILANHKELESIEMYSLNEAISQKYDLGYMNPTDSTKNQFDLKSLDLFKNIDLLIIAKPKTAFGDEEKVLLDQYVMNGGKMLWMLDVANVEMDTLFTADKIMSYPYNLNLTDLLFSYGARLNNTVVKDLRNQAPVNMQVASLEGNAQNARVPWVYFPLGITEASNKNVITKNVGPVKFEFPSSIDVLDRQGIKGTVLYQSSDLTQTQTIPSFISLEEAKNIIKDTAYIALFNDSSKSLAVLLEGEFTSAYKGRIQSTQVPNFIEKSKSNKMIIIADGDVGRNQVIDGKPTQLGMDYSTRMIYGNKDFLLNAVDYLLDDEGVMTLRNRTVELRYLNKQEIIQSKGYWQWLNLLVPIFAISLIGGVIILMRKKRFK